MTEYKTQIPMVYLARESTNFPKWKITNSKDIFRYIQDNTIYDKTMTTQEEAWVLYLNNANNLIGLTQVSIGGITGTVVDIKKIFATGILLLATQIICIHNHPSGCLTPSELDKNLCKRIKETGAIMDIQLLDFIIVTEDSYRSFADNGEL